MVTRNHGHIGAADIYARLAAAQDLCAFVTSGAQLQLDPGASVLRAAHAPPMCFGAPAGDEPPLVLDCGVMQYIQGRRADRRDQILKLAPDVVRHWMGFGIVCQVWGGLLAGLPIDPAQAVTTYRHADQGAMLYVFDPAQFIDLDQFKREMDDYARRVRQLEPVQGTEGAYLPGAIEIEREQSYRREGIPLREHHQQALERAAAESGLSVPWR